MLTGPCNKHPMIPHFMSTFEIKLNYCYFHLILMASKTPGYPSYITYQVLCPFCLVVRKKKKKKTFASVSVSVIMK